jgi:two-component system cell cycle sensor histidine kinase/response regulator CckA
MAIYVLDHDGRVIVWNPGAERIFGWSEDEALGQPLQTVPEGDRAGFQQLLERSRGGEALESVEVRRQRKGNEPVDLLLSTAALRDAEGQIRGTVHLAIDITEQKELEEQFRQAQKLESIGQLAGGVAHDFNNLLTVIMGRSEILLNRLPADSPNRRGVQLIQTTAQRAATLAKQLLAFGRRQVLEHRVLDLNEVVNGVVPMLKRLIGEDIELIVHPGTHLDRVRGDRGQLEQVIMNLVVNARDAMSEGGQITLETDNVVLSEEYARERVGSRPGPHVMLAVTDTGTGMDRATQARIFEPFFTTKELGKGTGLGLATVYGIVKQSGGNIWVYSEPGHGTTFKIYLPRVDDALDTVGPAAIGPGRGSETILVAEDDDEVRALAREVLEGYGYTILEAARPADALQIAERYAGAINLLLTDVVMPQMSGRQLADRLAALRPEMRVLYVSGYPGEAIVQQGRLDAGTQYLPKPIMPPALAAKVREVLDALE